MTLIYAMKFLEADEIKVYYDRSALKTKGQEAEGFSGFLLSVYFLDQEFPKMYVWLCYNYISNMLPREFSYRLDVMNENFGLKTKELK